MYITQTRLDIADHQQKDLGAIKAAGTAFSGTSVSVTIAPTLGGNGTNAYFIGMTSVATAGGQVINYSDRFTLTGMTGTFDATTEAANEAISGTSGPDTENQVASAAGTATGTTATTATVDAAAVAAAAAAATQTGEFTVAYSLQTGPVRYAPMPSPPGTSITATNTAPLFPTSAATIATDFLSAASVTMTYSASNTYSVASHTNTVSGSTPSLRQRLTIDRQLLLLVQLEICKDSWKDGRIDMSVTIDEQGDDQLLCYDCMCMEYR